MRIEGGINYIHQLILSEYDGTNSKQLAQKYDYTHNWVVKLIKQHERNVEAKSIGKEVEFKGLTTIIEYSKEPE